jgi:hypothetical protein
MCRFPITAFSGFKVTYRKIVQEKNNAMVDFEYDKTFLKSMVSDFFFNFLKIHHKVAGGAQSSEELKSVLQASAYVRL